MRPAPQRVLEQTVQGMAAELAPTLEPRYRQATVGMWASLLVAVREEFDRAAARRVDENRAIRTLFAQGAPLVSDAALADRLRDAAAGVDADLAIPALDAGNRALRALLIELHAHVEESASPGASALAEAIWRELALSTQRRKLSLGAF